MKINYDVEIAEDAQQLMQLLEEKIYEFNSTKIDKDDGRLFSRIVRNEDKDIIAGMVGWTWAGVCEITQLWVNEKLRGSGIGGTLLEAAEAEAKDKGCIMILVKTYSFQALHFYLKHGFDTEQVLSGFPVGYKYYTLIKRID
jgi:GNAT superfamily N-acetyltransferase